MYRVTVEEVSIPRAIVDREPYIMAVVATGRKSPQQVQTQPVKGVTRKKPGRPKWVLLDADPGAYIAADIVVMESDKGYRRVGDIIGRLRHALDRIPRSVAASVGAASSAIRPALDLVSNTLRRSGDDELGRVSLALKAKKDGAFDEKVVELKAGRCSMKVKISRSDSAAGGPESGSDPEHEAAPKKFSRWSEIDAGAEVVIVVDDEDLEGVVHWTEGRSAGVGVDDAVFEVSRLKDIRPR